MTCFTYAFHSSHAVEKFIRIGVPTCFKNNRIFINVYTFSRILWVESQILINLYVIVGKVHIYGLEYMIWRNKMEGLIWNGGSDCGGSRAIEYLQLSITRSTLCWSPQLLKMVAHKCINTHNDITAFTICFGNYNWLCLPQCPPAISVFLFNHMWNLNHNQHNNTRIIILPARNPLSSYNLQSNLTLLLFSSWYITYIRVS